ncbi:MAG: tetratricopeptide repeat protein [Fibrobacteria bacterium]
MTRSVSSPGIPGRRSPWILDPWNDLAWFILAPAWILALAWAVRDWAVLGALGGMLLAVGATGHHLPGFIRAYSDPGLFSRFKGRFLAAPVFFVGISVLFASFGLRGLELILVLWGAWHGAMQVSGFLRIYDSKVGSTSTATAWLDWAMCATWFGGALLYSEAKLHLLGLTLHRCGIPLPTPEAVFSARQCWIILATVVTSAFFANVVGAIRKGRGPNPLKFAAMGISFAFWWFCMVQVRIPLLGLLLFEIFHDVQYNVLVWGYQRNRVAGGKPTGMLERFLFHPAPVRIALYLGLILGYGALGAAANYGGLGIPDMAAAETPVWSLILSHLFIASAFLHFYYDGFIWKVRESAFRAGMGVADAPSSISGAAARRPAKGPAAADNPDALSGTPRPHAWLGTGLRGALFVVPVLVLGYSQWGNIPGPEVEALRRMAPLLPHTWEVQLALGSMEIAAGNPAAAATSLSRAHELNPSLDVGGHRVLAQLYSKGGDMDRAIAEYRLAVAEKPEDMFSRYDLGLLLKAQGRLAEAIPELRAVADRNPGNGGTNYSAGLALMLFKQVPEAIPYLERCVTADSLHKLGWNYLGVARESRGLLPEAIACYRRALAVDTGYAEARRNLRQAEARFREVRAGAAKSLGAEPRSEGAPQHRTSGSAENPREERMRDGKLVLQPGKPGLHLDGIAFPHFTGAQENFSLVHGSLPFPEPDAVHGYPGAGGLDPFPEGSKHLRLHLVPGQGAGGNRQQAGRGKQGGRPHGIPFHIAFHSTHGLKTSIPGWSHPISKPVGEPVPEAQPI